MALLFLSWLSNRVFSQPAACLVISTMQLRLDWLAYRSALCCYRTVPYLRNSCLLELDEMVRFNPSSLPPEDMLQSEVGLGSSLACCSPEPLTGRCRKEPRGRPDWSFFAVTATECNVHRDRPALALVRGCQTDRSSLDNVERVRRRGLTSPPPPSSVPGRRSRALSWSLGMKLGHGCKQSLPPRPRR
jgi:hypothetical protein